MKPRTILLLVLGLNLMSWNIDTNLNTVEKVPEILNNDQGPTEVYGYWKKIAAGEDANKNRVLDQSEIIKNPEPAAYDTLYFGDHEKCRISGMGMELNAFHYIRIVDGKKMIMIYTREPLNETEEKTKATMKFEIVSLDHVAKKLVVIPPIYSFMLVAYERIK